MQKATKEKMMDVEGLAEFFNVKKSRIYQETRKKGLDTIPCIYVGKYPRFNLPEVIDWFKRQQEQEAA